MQHNYCTLFLALFVALLVKLFVVLIIAQNVRTLSSNFVVFLLEVLSISIVLRVTY